MAQSNNTGQPLPQNPFQATETESDCHEAFKCCLFFEAHHGWHEFSDTLARPTSENIMLKTSPQTAARILGYTLIYAPDSTGRLRLAREINDCNRDAEVFAGLAHLYTFGFIRIFRNPKGPTPSTSALLSPRKSFEDEASGQEANVLRAGSTPSELKKRVLLREDYKCAFTGRTDRDTLIARRAANPSDVLVPAPVSTAHVEVVHIISQSISTGVEGLTDNAKAKLQWYGSAAALITRFSGTDVHVLLGGDTIHTPLNTMALSHDSHKDFDQLEVYLEPDLDEQLNPIPDHYKLKTFPGWEFLLEASKSPVVFKAGQGDDGTAIPTPSPKLLALHAAAAQIAHMSAAAEILDRYEMDEDSGGTGLSAGDTDMAASHVKYFQLVRALHDVQRARERPDD
ncbi:hypothetical protein L226DRAFT_569323 [Lentinus tigrinus ALCF2SS1-7]|uniref:uncharacterized protein n=1 Tax=Lentinus tigrinus ALCF2SS1-7 TaxID=1328758 RepID=UPI00116622E2|nr:hypothetical protein L226DRAFT_569323 [Lentinus tigrinus ALCF2SS1-7]